MKKCLLFSAAALATVMSVSAETITYDFNKNPRYCEIIFAPTTQIFGEGDNAVEGLATGGNYDFIDKTGTAKNTCGSIFNVESEAGNKDWHAVKNRCIDLYDGQTYTLEGEEEGFTAIDKSHPFICWDQEGKGPSRTLLMKGWGTDDAWTDADYNAIDESNWVATKHAIAFNRNSNTGSRTGTYIQFPEVKDPTSLTIYIGNAGGKYLDKGLYAEVVPVVDGTVGEIIAVEGPADAKAKRYYKQTVKLPEGLKGNVAFRIGCGGSELNLYHVVIEAAAGDSAIEDIFTDAEADENAPVYNVLGQQVDESYKGIVIKNGKKYIQK